MKYYCFYISFRADGSVYKQSTSPTLGKDHCWVLAVTEARKHGGETCGGNANARTSSEAIKKIKGMIRGQWTDKHVKLHPDF